MTRDVITVQRDTPVRQVIQVLLDNRISGVPVVEQGRVIGIVSEGDLILRERAQRQRGSMAYLAQQLFEDHAKLAEEYRKAHGMLAEQVMTREVITCAPGTPVEEIASTMARRHLRRLPVVEDGLLVGIVSRADVLRAAESRPARPGAPTPLADHQIRTLLFESLKREPWAEVEWLSVDVSAGRVVLRGMTESAQEREAIELAARAIAGVTSVVNELTVDPNLTS
jgi:CBS domain-containing protein